MYCLGAFFSVLAYSTPFLPLDKNAELLTVLFSSVFLASVFTLWGYLLENDERKTGG